MGEKQGGNERAEYGENLIKQLSIELTVEFGKGFTVANIRNMRQFYLTFQNGYALRSELTWTHYRLLMRVENENARAFYEDECVKSNWSTRQLERQINSFFYERILSSKDKEVVKNEINLLEPQGKLPKDIIRDPYVLEFLGLPDQHSFAEKDLENALIEHLQKFLLELGRGFSFVARQKRITFDGRHFYIDLLFYNYILKCFVIIDLKIGDLTHQDIVKGSYIRVAEADEPMSDYEIYSYDAYHRRVKDDIRTTDFKDFTILDDVLLEKFILNIKENKPEYPIKAVREAVLNALMHRDYSIHTEGAPVRIVMYSDRIEITNEGGLYGRITVDGLGKVHADTRNQTLTHILEVQKTAENRYSGIPTIYYEMKRMRLCKPEFTNRRGAFTVTLKNGVFVN